MNTSGGRRVLATKTRSKTYVDVALHVPDEDEVAGSGVANVGVDGDRAPRVSLDRIERLRTISGDGAASECAGVVYETDGGGGRPKHVRLLLKVAGDQGGGSRGCKGGAVACLKLERRIISASRILSHSVF